MVRRAIQQRLGIFPFPVLALLLALVTASADEPPVLRGEWAATVGSSKTLRGRWIGQALPGKPDVMQGSWTLKGNRGRTVLTGTWTARRKGPGWQGTWSASDKQGRTASGTWRADELNLQSGTMEQLLIAASKKQASGSWRGGRQQGYWWIKSAVRAAGNR